MATTKVSNSLHGQDGDYNSGNDDCMNKKKTTPVAKVGTWTRWRLSHWLILLHGQDGDYFSAVDDYMDKMQTTTMAKIITWKR